MAIKLSDIASASEIIGAVAIVFSLIFVGTELRQNTLSVRASTFQSITDSVTEFSLSIGSDPVLADIYSRGLANPSDLADNELRQFNMLLTTIGRRIESAYIQRELGLLKNSQWAGFNSLCKGVLLSSGGIALIERFPSNFSPEFTNYIATGCE